jgi:uncharacterized protein (DUF427 family)
MKMMNRYQLLVVCGVLLTAGCLTTESYAQTPAREAQRTEGAASKLPASYLDESNRLLAAGGPRWLPSPKRVRVYFEGELIVDSTHAYLLRESAVPAYYFPESDVKASLLVPSKMVKNAPNRGDASYWSIKVGERVAQDAAWTYRTPVHGAEFLKGYVALDWNKMDAWFEEKEQVFVHPRDPFLRIDSVATSRRVRVVLNGETVADSDSAVILMEPGQPIRYYVPIADARVELLRPSETTSRCPYKGLANYYSVKVGGKTFQDIVWSYRAPTLEVGKVAGMVSFYNERVDAIFVDGVEVPKPLQRRNQQ